MCSRQRVIKGLFPFHGSDRLSTSPTSTSPRSSPSGRLPQSFLRLAFHRLLFHPFPARRHGRKLFASATRRCGGGGGFHNNKTGSVKELLERGPTSNSCSRPSWPGLASVSCFWSVQLKTVIHYGEKLIMVPRYSGQRRIHVPSGHCWLAGPPVHRVELASPIMLTSWPCPTNGLPYFISSCPLDSLFPLVGHGRRLRSAPEVKTDDGRKLKRPK